MISLCLFQPDIPQNVGASMRLCAALGCGLEIVEPCGFPWDERKIRQAGLDYIDALAYRRHTSWATFREFTGERRLILLTTRAAQIYTEYAFRDGDILIAGRESAGVPNDVHMAADARLCIPMQPGLRSLNVVTACAMVMGEALRQGRLSRD